MISTEDSTLNKFWTLSDDWVRWIHCFHCFYSLLTLLTLLITLILLTLLTLLGEGPRVIRILEHCLIDHVYYIIPVVVVSWNILDVGKRDHFGQCFRLDWRLESPHQTGGWSWVTSKMAGQVFRLRRILMTTLIQFHPLASLSRIWKDFKTFFGGYQVKSRKCTIYRLVTFDEYRWDHKGSTKKSW